LYLRGSSSFDFDPPATGATFLTVLVLEAAGAALATGFLTDDRAGFPIGFLAGADGASSFAAAGF